MRLAGLDITGFKSFAKHVHLQFNEGNTAIVGPNGSGKSNIADAIRWVLGEQSMKTLRGKKLEDVIYSGGPTRGRLGMAEVSLTLENSNEDDEFPEVVITRRLFRSGESTYLINNRQVRLSDVNEMLAKAGFAQKTYTVIGQGMADSFVNASPVERKSMFEDATGVTPLLIKKEQTERRLEQTKENLVRGKDHLSELEPRLRSLKRQASRARQREEVEKELREKEQIWFAGLWYSYNETLKNAEDQLRGVENKIREAAKQIESLQPKEESMPQIKNLPKLREELERLRQEEQELIIILAQQGHSSEDLIDRREEERKAKEKEHQRLSHLLQEISFNKERQEQLLHQTRENLREIQNQLLSSRSASFSESFSAEIEKDIKEIVYLQDLLIEKLNSVESLEELSLLQEEAEKVRVLLQNLQETLKKSGDGGKEDSLTKLQEELDKKIKERETLEKNLTDTRVEVAKLETQLRAVDERLAELSKTEETKTAPPAVVKRLEEVRTKRTELAKETEDLESVLFKSHQDRQKHSIELEKQRNILHSAEQEKYSIEVNAAGNKARMEDTENQIKERINYDFLIQLRGGSVSVPSKNQTEGLEQEIHGLRKKIEQIGGIDPNVIQEESDVEHRVNELNLQIEDLEKASADLKEGIKELERHIHLQFNDGMRIINENFNIHFRQVFGGGKAGLSVVKPKPIVHTESELDSANDSPPFEGEIRGDENYEISTEEHIHELPTGVEIKANPPGKKLTSIAQLSGGEKALTSVALLFAIISLRSSPFIVFDEVDAALDEANSRRFAHMLREFSGKTQFLTITHNRSTMEASDSLYGVTMEDEGVSQLLSVRLSEVPENFVTSSK